MGALYSCAMVLSITFLQQRNEKIHIGWISIRSEYFLFDKHLTIPVFDSYHSLLFLHRPKGQKNMKEGIHRSLWKSGIRWSMYRNALPDSARRWKRKSQRRKVSCCASIAPFRPKAPLPISSRILTSGGSCFGERQRLPPNGCCSVWLWTPFVYIIKYKTVAWEAVWWFRSLFLPDCKLSFCTILKNRKLFRSLLLRCFRVAPKLHIERRCLSWLYIAILRQRLLIWLDTVSAHQTRRSGQKYRHLD